MGLSDTLPVVIDLEQALGSIAAPWTPVVAAELNGQQVKLARLEGEFVWHQHDEADELFVVLDGELMLRFEHGERRLRAGQMLVVPRGLRHCPVAEAGAKVLLFEAAGVINTGDANDPRRVEEPRRL